VHALFSVHIETHHIQLPVSH